MSKYRAKIPFFKQERNNYFTWKGRTNYLAHIKTSLYVQLQEAGSLEERYLWQLRNVITKAILKRHIHLDRKAIWCCIFNVNDDTYFLLKLCTSPFGAILTSRRSQGPSKCFWTGPKIHCATLEISFPSSVHLQTDIDIQVLGHVLII